MGILSFIKEAGEKLFGAATPSAQAAPAAAPVDVAALNQKAGEAIATYIRSQGLNADGERFGPGARSGHEGKDSRRGG
jgi:hypothetical protein